MRHGGPALLSCLAAALVQVGPAGAEKITVDDDTSFTVGALIQPQLTVTEDAAPDGGAGTDFFVRRARFLFTGWFDSHIGFLFQVDQGNWGKNGDFTAPRFGLLDAAAIYKFGPELTLTAGSILLPFLRIAYQGAGSLNTLDFPVSVIKLAPTGVAFRDVGIEARGLLAGERLYYRAGVFSGVAGEPDDPATPDVDEEVNPSDLPRLTGTVRFNIAGKEDVYAPPSLLFAEAPVISVGVAADWQKEALGTGDDGRYLALAADVFADVPLSADLELSGQAAVIRYDNYLAGSSATAFYVEGGVRIGKIQPVGAFELFDGEAEGTRTTNIKLGLNYWIAKYNYNLKGEVVIPDQEGAGDGPPVFGTLQAQAVF